MQSVLFGLAVLACPLGMGAMMWMMMRSKPAGGDGGQEELARLRREIDDLKAGRDGRAEDLAWRDPKGL